MSKSLNMKILYIKLGNERQCHITKRLVHSFSVNIIVGKMRSSKVSFSATQGTKVAIYHFVGNFMLKPMGNFVNLATCAVVV